MISLCLFLALVPVLVFLGAALVTCAGQDEPF
jgi:hypothetical protein